MSLPPGMAPYSQHVQHNKAVCTARKTAVPILVKANMRFSFPLLNEDVEFTL
jgi:hypothetical protein